MLKEQAAHNTKEQVANSSDLKHELINAIIAALDAPSTMGTQALGSESVQDGLRDILLGPAGLYEALKALGNAKASNQTSAGLRAT